MGAQAVRLSNVDINNALKNRDFETLFQPIFDLSNGALARVETFVRWRHASLGVLPPGAFISFFESQGRMSELTRYVLNEALTQYKEWRGPYAPGFSINLALSDLNDEAFVTHFNVLLREHEFPAELITLECPMPPVDQDLPTVNRNFERLSQTGARLAIEVRGRTNDLLSKIDPFPFDEIKTGGTAILRFARTVRGPGLTAISELLELANEQNAAITAVGVEDQASLAALRSLGFAAAQGNHLGKVGAINKFSPAHVNEVRDLLGLEQLSKKDLAALFRSDASALPTSKTESETPQETASEQASSPTKDEKIAQFPASAHEQGDLAKPTDDDLVERLAARIAKNETANPAPGRLKPASARKAAAIARVKKKAIKSADTADNKIGKGNVTSDLKEDENLARNLQARLSEEFDSDEKASTAPNKTKGAPTKNAKPTSKGSDVQETNMMPDEKSEKAPPPKAKKLTRKAKPAATKTEPNKPAATKAATKKPKAAKPTTNKTKTSPDKAKPAAAPAADKPESQPVEEERIVVQGSVSKNAVSSPSSGIEQQTVSAKMLVGTSSAQFRPILHVGTRQSAPMMAQTTAQQTPERKPATQMPDIEIVDPATLGTGANVNLDTTPKADEIKVDKPSQPTEQQDKSHFLKSAAEKIDTTIQATASIEQADQTAKDEESVWIDASEDIESEYTPRVPQNFLTRRYQIPQWPNHFWPKSWKRAWKRRAAFKAKIAAEKKEFEEFDD